MFIHKDAIRWYREIIQNALLELKRKKTLSKPTADRLINELEKVIEFCNDSHQELFNSNNVLRRLSNKLNEIDKSAFAARGYSNNILVSIDSMDRTFSAMKDFLHMTLPRLSHYDFVLSHLDFMKTSLEQLLSLFNHLEETSKLCADEVKQLMSKTHEAEQLLKAQRQEEEKFINNVLSWKIK